LAKSWESLHPEYIIKLLPKIHIIGQGLAGSILGYILLKNGFEIRISDNGHKSSSSMVAAGMWHPLAFKNLHQSWLVDTLLPVADNFYHELETELGLSFYHHVELVRFFPNILSANEWDERSQHPELVNYITDLHDPYIKKNFVQPFDHGVIKGSGWLNVPLFISGIQKYFEERGLYTLLELDTSTIPENTQELTIFCTGSSMKTHTIFNKVLLRPNKGQLLTIEAPQISLDRMLNFGKFVIPMGDNLFRLGATYELENPNPDPTDEGRIEILSSFEQVSSSPYKVVDHKSGYRPATHDRKPVIGMLPDHPHVGTFNGFGSKGVMLIPHFAEEFASFLKGDSGLHPEVRLARYFK
jgi:glycine oxidase